MTASATPPLPGDSHDVEMRREIARRRRLLDGAWRGDAVGKLKEFFPDTTVQRLGHVDMTRNLHKQVTNELSVRYPTPPTKLHPDEDPAERMAALLKVSGLWPKAGENERYTVSARTSFIRTDWVGPEVEGHLSHTVVTGDLVYIECDPDEPSVPVFAIHARLRSDPTDKGAQAWFWDVFDIREDAPTYRVLKPRGDSNDIDKAEDFTEHFLGVEATAYPWIVDGDAVIPLVPYRADPGTDGLWNWRARCEDVEATLIEAAFWSFFGYCTRDAGHPTRALADGEFIGGLETAGVGGNARTEITADPTSMLFVRSSGNGAAHAMEWGPGMDPERLQMAIQSYVAGAVVSAGLSPDDLQRSGAAESGYAIALKSEAKRREQRRMEPAFKWADAQTLAICAALQNRWGSEKGFPEEGWDPQYPAIPLTASERKDRREDALVGVELGTKSLVDVVMAEHPGMDRDAAAVHLERVQQERARFRAPAQSMT